MSKINHDPEIIDDWLTTRNRIQIVEDLHLLLTKELFEHNAENFNLVSDLILSRLVSKEDYSKTIDGYKTYAIDLTYHKTIVESFLHMLCISDFKLDNISLRLKKIKQLDLLFDTPQVLNSKIIRTKIIEYIDVDFLITRERSIQPRSLFWAACDSIDLLPRLSEMTERILNNRKSIDLRFVNNLIRESSFILKDHLNELDKDDILKISYVLMLSAYQYSDFNQDEDSPMQNVEQMWLSNINNIATEYFGDVAVQTLINISSTLDTHIPFDMWKSLVSQNKVSEFESLKVSF